MWLHVIQLHKIKKSVVNKNSRKESVFWFIHRENSSSRHRINLVQNVFGYVLTFDNRQSFVRGRFFRDLPTTAKFYRYIRDLLTTERLSLFSEGHYFRGSVTVGNLCFKIT